MFNQTVFCPHCGANITQDWSKYIVSTSVNENRSMGSEIEYTIACDDFKCLQCKKNFKVNGFVWEYPVEAYNAHELNVSV